MNVDINNTNSIIEVSESASLMDQFDVENGLLGIERDTFLLLSRHVNLENTDDKIRNV
jgi:hypothetical protein